MNPASADVRFIVGSRQLWAVPRRVRTVSCSLEELIAGQVPTLANADADGTHGFRFLSVPQSAFGTITDRFSSHVAGGYQAYRRHYLAMKGDFESYLGRFSSRTRSTLRRKRRKLETECGGAVDVREYRSPAEIELFLRHALPLSRRTYQARLLGSGLPEDDAMRSAMLALAQSDSLRAYLLFIGGEAAAYLYLPVRGQTLVYDYLGYAPQFAPLSPGTVLQIEALERLFAERRYRYFDFTEGEGAHKELFGTDSAQACSFFLLKGTAGNRLLLGALSGFDAITGAAARLARASGAHARLRKLLRG